jgi:hypothetical protein
MKSVRTALAAVVAWLIPSLAAAQQKPPPAIPTLGAAGAVVLGIVLNRRRPK